MTFLGTLLIAASTSAISDFATTTSAGATQAPVAIDRCEIPRGDATSNWRRWSTPSPTTGDLRIAFHDRASRPVASVAFSVDYRGQVETVKDAGTFSPGAPIDHRYSGRFTDFAYLGSRPNRCRVVSVTFADGSIWSTPAGDDLAESEMQ
jgi:hypothetical protein